jgi:hypothetical protein
VSLSETRGFKEPLAFALLIHNKQGARHLLENFDVNMFGQPYKVAQPSTPVTLCLQGQSSPLEY